MRFKGFIGQAYTAKSLNVECQRLVNWYPEVIESGFGKEGEVAFFMPTQGLTNVLEAGNGPIRLTYTDPRGTVFVVSGSTLYKLSYTGTVWSGTSLGTLNTSAGTVRADSNKLASGDTTTVFVDGTDSYTYEYVASSGAETFDDYAGRGYSQVDEATHVVFIDGYFIFNKPGTGIFYVSEWGSFNVDPLSFATAEGDPDNLNSLIANHRYLYLFGDRSIEVFSDTGNAAFPFERISGGFIEKGCLAPYSVAKIDGFVLWLGRDQLGQGMVYSAQGATPQKVSTHAIENAIQGYGIDSLTTADAFTYSMGGHSFYVLNFPEATWVYDLTTKMWHERAYNNGGILERHRANYHTFTTQYGIHLVGDYEDNRIYQLSDSVYTDDGVYIQRIRSCPHVSGGLKRVFHHSLQIDMEMGVGLTGGVQGEDPQIVLDWSDDGGHTWSNEKQASIGKIGAYKTRAIFRQLGQSRDRVYRVKITEPVKAILMGAEIELEVGAS